MKSYPIWMDVTSCIYKGSKSYGIRNDGLTQIFVGTGARNSHLFGKIHLTHRDLGEDGKSFGLYVDGKLIKEGIVNNRKLVISHDVHKVLADLLAALTLARKNGDNLLSPETKLTLDKAIARARGAL